MFYSFKPGRQPRPAKEGPATDQLAERIVGRSLKLQRRCADFLGKKTRKLPAKSLKATVITIAIAAGSYSLFLVASGFWGKPPENFFLREKAQLSPTDNGASRKRKQQAFEAYLDSLEKAFIRDSINSIQP